MISVANTENFNDLINEGFTIVDYYTTTCVPCKMLSRILEDLTVDYPFVNVVKVNTTDYPELGKGIEAVPTVKFYKDGVLKDVVIGLMDEDEIVDKITEYYYE